MRRPPRGGWKDFTQMKPAAKYDIRYGHDLIRTESATWPRTIAVTSPTAYKVVSPRLSREPQGFAIAKTLDFDSLKGVAESLPDDADLVLGIGGGLALDAAKYVALTRQLPIVIIPTVVSTGSIIHGLFARWEGLNLSEKSKWCWIDPEHVLVDYDVVLSAPEYLNTAGIGDVLCGHAGLTEWKRGARLGLCDDYDEAVASDMLQHHREIVEGFPATFSDDGRLTPRSIKFIMTAVKDRDTRRVIHPGAPLSDHLFLQALELINNRTWVHGELAALGSVIVTWYCEPPDVAGLIERMDTCRVRWRPKDMDLSRDALSKALAFCPEYFSDASRGRNVTSALRSDPIVGETFDRLWRFLHAS